MHTRTHTQCSIAAVHFLWRHNQLDNGVDILPGCLNSWSLQRPPPCLSNALSWPVLPGWGGSSSPGSRVAWGGLQPPAEPCPFFPALPQHVPLTLGLGQQLGKCMLEQCPTQTVCHFLPLLSLLSTEILWAGYKMGRHRAVDGRPQIWFFKAWNGLWFHSPTV